MALDKETRESIASDLSTLTWYEHQDLCKIFSEPQQKKSTIFFFGSPKKRAQHLLEQAKHRRDVVVYDLKVNSASLHGIVETIEKLESLIVEFSAEEESVD